MAHTSSIFDSQPIRVQNVNGFDLSHLNSGTAKCGQLTPVLCRLLMQNTKFSLGCSLSVELPPLATAFFGRIDAHVEVFFTPCSVLYGGWKQFIMGAVSTSFSTYQAAQGVTAYYLPRFTLDVATASVVSGLEATNDGLLDYMNFRFTSAIVGTPRYFNLLPLVSYHLIWNVFYRNPSVTRTIFEVNPNVPNDSSSSNLNRKNVSLIWHSFYTELNGNSPYSCGFSSAALTFPDGVSVFSMRQRNYPRDYFTSGSISPQQPGSAISRLDFTVDLNTGDGGFTIGALRAANTLAKFYEAGNYDPSYKGVMRAHFGSSPSDADRDEPIYIGRLVIPVYQKSVYNTSSPAVDSSDQTVNNSVNPFGDVLGARGAHGAFTGEGSITQSFKAGCFGYLVGLFSLVPHANYAYGIEKHWDCLNIGDFPFPELQSVGMDAIKNSEIYSEGALPTGDFCYIPRFSYWKYVDDSVHGELRPGKTLDNFVLQRRFASLPVFGTAFLEIPQNALDGVFAVDVQNSHFSCWYEVFWVFKAVMPLAAFCVPTLGELQDTHTIKTTQGGSRL